MARKSKKKSKSFLKLLLTGGLFLVLSVVAVFLVLQIIMLDLPQLDTIQDYKPPLISRMFDQNGHLVAEFFTERRTLVRVEDLPAHVKNAFIAAEDAHFYQHQGIDYFGLVRAVLNEAKYKVIGGQRMGGSTITQQTAKTMLLSRKRTYTRKLKEMILAHRIEQSLTKDQILGLYLNQIYFGHGAYGIEEAAQTYYGVSAKNLTLGQAASLASVPKSPNRINPISDPVRVRARKDYVLEQMLANRLTTATQVSRARSEAIVVKAAEPKKYVGRAPHYAEAVRRAIVDEFGEEVLYHGALDIHTAMDVKMQIAGQDALRQGLREVDKRHGWRGASLNLDRSQQATLSAAKKDGLFWDLQPFADTYAEGIERAVQNIRFTQPKNSQIVGGIVTKVNKDDVAVDLGAKVATLPFSKMSWARPFNPETYTPAPKSPRDVVKIGDVILVKIENLSPLTVSLEQFPKVDGALAAVDPTNHRVVALVGGYDFHKSSFNRALQAKRQAGSSFKPFVYGMAIERETATAATVITDAPRVFLNGGDEGQWKPRNHSRKYLGDITVRTCLIRSVNTCSIALLESVGVSAVHDLAAKVGLMTDKTPFPRDLTLALGSADVIPLSLVNAFTIFPSLGKWAQPVMIEKIVTRNGQVLKERRVEPIQVIRPETAFIMTSIMEGVMQRGPGRNVKGVGQPLAGKTGTTNENRSAWFVGFSPTLVAGVYVGFDDNESLGPNEFGVRNALPIWGQFMRESLKNTPPTDFSEPEGIVWRLIDSKSGLLARSYEHRFSDDEEAPEEEGGGWDSYAPKGAILEAFIHGTEPQQTVSDNGPPPLELFEGSSFGP